MKLKLTSAIAIASIAGAASASTFSYSTVAGPIVFDDANDVNLGTAPAGTWTSATVVADYDDFGGTGSFQSEAFLGFGSSVGGFEFTQGFGFSASNALNSSASATLEWNIFFDPATPYSGSSDLFLNGFSEFASFDLQLSNISITLGTDLYDGTPQPIDPGTPSSSAPTAIDLGVIGNAGVGLNLDTFLSDFDTDIAFYAQNGDVIATNDDTGGLQSQILLDDSASATPAAYPDPAPIAGLGEGTYYIAVGGFNSLYANGFDATGGLSNGTIGGQVNGIAFDGTLAEGEIQWYQVTVVPAPGAAALIGFAGLAAVRRRR